MGFIRYLDGANIELDRVLSDLLGYRPSGYE
jgi:hypothetical protein